MKLTVDRITEGFAVLEKEDMTHIEVPVADLPQNVKEGNVLDFDGCVYSIDSRTEDAVSREAYLKRDRLISESKKILKN